MQTEQSSLQASMCMPWSVQAMAAAAVSASLMLPHLQHLPNVHAFHFMWQRQGECWLQAVALQHSLGIGDVLLVALLGHLSHARVADPVWSSTAAAAVGHDRVCGTVGACQVGTRLPLMVHDAHPSIHERRHPLQNLMNDAVPCRLSRALLPIEVARCHARCHALDLDV